MLEEGQQEEPPAPIKIEPFKDIDTRPFAKVLSKANTYAQ
jgi:hypothetical protein